MTLSINIDTSNSKAEAFINFIKTLDFVDIYDDNENSDLSSKQKLAIDIGLESLEKGRKIPHKKVMEQFKAIYPKYFNND